MSYEADALLPFLFPVHSGPEYMNLLPCSLAPSPYFWVHRAQRYEHLCSESNPWCPPGMCKKGAQAFKPLHKQKLNFSLLEIWFLACRHGEAQQFSRRPEMWHTTALLSMLIKHASRRDSDLWCQGTVAMAVACYWEHQDWNWFQLLWGGFSKWREGGKE